MDCTSVSVNRFCPQNGMPYQDLLSGEHEAFDDVKDVRMKLSDRRRVPLRNIDGEPRRQIHKFKDCLQGRQVPFFWTF